MNRTESGPTTSPKVAGPENLTAARPLSLIPEDSAQRPETAGEQLRRRRAASLRCLPMPDDRRDPLEPDRSAPLTFQDLDRWAATLWYLRSVGLPGLPPAHVARALAAHPQRYRHVLPGAETAAS